MQISHAAIGAAVVVAAFAAGAVGCAREPAQVERRATRAERIAAGLAQPVRTQRWAIGEHELLLVEAPTSNGIEVVRRQCFVWRDAQFRTASLACTDDVDDVEAPTPDR